MSKKRFGFDLLSAQVADAVVSEISGRASFFETYWENHGFGSPIEALLFHSVLNATEFRVNQEWEWTVVHAGLKELREAEAEPDFRHHLLFRKQDQAFGWCADFVIHAWADHVRGLLGERPPGWRTLVVECDGHDFHERTKEQAARDRKRDRTAQAGDSQIYRFTGSEIWRNPLGCALEIIEWANMGV